MKCPNCGLEVVIATDMCPQCGYQHDFDGSILPTGSASAHESEQDSERRHRFPKRDGPQRVRASEAASSRWTEAGTFGARGEYESRNNGGEKNRTAESGQGMRWYNFVVTALLPLTGISYFGFALSSISVLYTELVYYGSILVFAPYLLVIRVAMVVLFCIFGAFAFVARSRLKSYLSSGVSLYLAVILVPAIVMAFSGIFLCIYTSWYYNLPQYIIELTASIVYASLTSVYFKKRASQFT